MAREIKITEMDLERFQIRGILFGENWNKIRHGGFGTEVKAITYSAMKIINNKDKAELYVIIDI